MDENLKLFSEALRLLRASRLTQALGVLRQYTSTHPFALYSEELDGIEQSLSLMLQYMKSGSPDPMRATLYRQLTDKAQRLARNMRADYRRRHVDFYREAHARSMSGSFSVERIRHEMETFVTDEAMLQLEPEERRDAMYGELHSRHFSFMQSLFFHIVCSDIWTDDYARDLTQVLLSLTVDGGDVQLVLSAVMLAAMNNFDLNKFRLLVSVSRHGNTEKMRQKALIGWALTMYDQSDATEQRALIAGALSEPHMADWLVNMQKQMLFCMDAEKDNATIQKDIMPTIIKNSNLTASHLGITEKDDDPMQDILAPDAADKSAEQTEEMFQRMLNMQKEGADIYFGGFSQMKRFPFFNSAANWFCPFSIHHPDISARVKNISNSQFLDHLLHSGPFCDSDKYSFAIALSSVIERLPAAVREMMGSEEAFGPVAPQEDMASADYVRRSALQDMYRFFRLYRWSNAIYNPFQRGNHLFIANPLLRGTAVDARLADIAQFLLKRRDAKDLAVIVPLMDDGDGADTRSLLLKGAYWLNYTDDCQKASSYYNAVLQRDADNQQAIAGLARAAFRSGDYVSAADAYSRLLEKNPDSQRTAIDYCIALTEAGHYDGAVKLLYKLDFMSPGTPAVKRVLAWALMGENKMQQAETEYMWLLESQDATPADSLNYAYCRWFQGDVQGAVSHFVSYLQKSAQPESARPAATPGEQATPPLTAEFTSDAAMLTLHDISTVDRILMQELVSETLVNEKDKS